MAQDRAIGAFSVKHGKGGLPDIPLIYGIGLISDIGGMLYIGGICTYMYT